MDRFDSLLNKRVLGVKMLYLFGLLAVVLVIVAYNIYKRDKIGGDESKKDGSKGAVTSEYFPGSSAVDRPLAEGQTALNDASASMDLLSNDQWLQTAVTWLVTNKKATALEAQAALTKYLNNEQMSYQQRQIVEMALDAVGFPPVIPDIGNLPEPPKVEDASSIVYPAPSPAPAPAPAPSYSGPVSHTVQRGESLSSIGAKYGMSWQRLYSLNTALVKNPRLIYAGQILNLT